MNFEVIDNGFQVLLMLLAGAMSSIRAFRTGSRKYVLLAGGYGCFAMGTFYYVLYLVIRGNVPQVFYVAEVAWMAAYLFLLALEFMRAGQRMKFYLPAAAVCAVVFCLDLFFDIPGYSGLMCIFWGADTGMLAYFAVWNLYQKAEDIKVDFFILLMVFLQIAVYVVSIFVKDYTRFNIYFAVDIALTLNWVSLYFLMKREEGKG